jgi:hypothetical protein
MQQRAAKRSRPVPKHFFKNSTVAVPPLDFATRLSADRVHHEVGDFKRWVATALGMKKHSTGSG